MFSKTLLVLYTILESGCKSGFNGHDGIQLQTTACQYV
jgi:hypothetical protein